MREEGVWGLVEIPWDCPYMTVLWKWIKIVDPDVALCAENAVKFQLKLSNQIKKKTKQKRSKKE